MTGVFGRAVGEIVNVSDPIDIGAVPPPTEKLHWLGFTGRNPLQSVMDPCGDCRTMVTTAPWDRVP